jgi:hypothetical protein
MATARPTLSWFGRYWSTDKQTLIGGVLDSMTSRFQRREDAELRLSQVLELNGEHCAGELCESTLPPEIFVHCGEIAQSVGACCPRCKKLLTKADALKAAFRLPMKARQST